MKAAIMAGGEGSRLRPITCTLPKPLAPVLDKPVMAYALDLLRAHGVTRAVATLMYLPDRVTDVFGDGREYGVSLTYRAETAPMGTAGSVKAAADFLDETFAVLSGDGLTDCDLTQALRFHRERGAMATMVLKRVKNPLEYGVVCTDPEGRVTRFVEKPGWGEVCSDAVNTGVYLLEPEALALVPPDKPCDFGRDLFPMMLEKGLKVCACQTEGYWCDIGDTASYLRAHADLLDGKMRLFSPLALRQPGCSVDGGAVIESPCFIGRGARVEAGARIGPYAVLGEGSVVEAEASVKRAVLMRGARAGRCVQLRACVLAGVSRAEEGASAFEESVLGEGAVLGARAMLMPGVRVWPFKRVAEGERVDQNVVWGVARERLMEGALLPFDAPAQAVRDAQAYAEAMRAREIVLARDDSPIAFACARAATAGLMAQGAQVIDVGPATLSQLRVAQWNIGAGGALYAERGGLRPLGARGAALSREERRRLLGLLRREDYPAPFSGATRPPIVMGRTELTYVGRMLEGIGARFEPPRAPQVAVHAGREQLLSLCEAAFRRAGCPIRAEWEEELMELGPSEMGVWLSDDGQSARFADARGMLTEPEKTCLLCFVALEAGARAIILPRGATRGAQALCEEYGAELIWGPSDEAAYQDLLIERDRDLFELFYDGIYAALAVAWTLSCKGLTLRGAVRALPRVHRRTHILPVDLREKGVLLRRLTEALPGADDSDGLMLEREGGWAWINPAGEKRECLIVSESADAEFARELCDFCAEQVKRAAREP